MEKYILSIDQGTTSSRAILFNKQGEIVATAQEEVALIYPHEGWVEADALVIWISVVNVVNECLIKANATWANIDSIGITNQRETTVVWDKKTGKPIYNAIIWQSRQSSSICASFADKKELIHEKTGLLINPFFSASKLKFILDNNPGSRERAKKGELLFGTIDSWLIYRLTNGAVHATDTTNASRTMLYNIFDLKWDEELLELFDIPKQMLPKVNPSVYDYGAATYFSKKVKILGVAGDQHASLFGHTCFKEGECKNTYGTGCFMLMNTGSKPILSKNGLLTTIAWNIDNKIVYALEGSVFIGGAVIQWLRDGLKCIGSAPEVDGAALSVKDNGGVYFVPAFVGLGTPYWDDDVRGSIFGMTRATTEHHICRAALESIAFQSKDVFDVMEKESNIKLKSLQVDGGASNSNYLMQFQSDILQINIEKPCCTESTALGVAFMAGYKSKFFGSFESMSKMRCIAKLFKPSIDKKSAQNACKKWELAVKSARTFKP